MLGNLDRLRQHPDLMASTALIYSSIARRGGDRDRAVEYLSRALENARVKGIRESTVSLRLMQRLAEVRLEQRRYADAKPVIDEARQLAEKILPTLDRTHCEIQIQYCTLLLNTGCRDEAKQQLDDIMPKIDQLQHQERVHLIMLGKAAITYMLIGDLETAEMHFKRVLRRWHPEATNPKQLHSRAIARYAGLLWLQARYDEAEMLFRQTRDVFQKISGDTGFYTIAMTNSLGVCLRDQRRFEEAENLLQDALDMRQRTLRDSDPHIADSMINLAKLHYFEGSLEKAFELAINGLQRRRQIVQPRETDIAEAELLLGLVLLEIGDIDSAVPLIESAHTTRRRILGEDDWLTALAACGVGACNLKCEEWDEANAILDKNASLIVAARGEINPWSQMTAQWLLDAQRKTVTAMNSK